MMLYEAGIRIYPSHTDQDTYREIRDWFLQRRRPSMGPHQYALILEQFGSSLRFLLYVDEEDGEMFIVAEHLSDWDLLGAPIWRVVPIPIEFRPLVMTIFDRFVIDWKNRHRREHNLDAAESAF